MNEIITLDTEVFLFLNGSNNSYLDVIMYWASDKVFWFPFYAMLLVYLAYKFKWKVIRILVMLTLLITITDQVSSSIIKPTVKRLRPSHTVELTDKIYISEAGKGGEYGFVSSHAANSFALFFFIAILLKKENKKIVYLIFAWAILVSYSRIYNGVHYPLDILGGILLAFLSTKLVFFMADKSNFFKPNVIHTTTL